MTRVAVIGPGRVGTALGLALRGAGYEVVAVAGRGRPSIEEFARRVPGAEPQSAVEAGRAGELVLLCVPDDALADLVRELARRDAVAEGSRWVHVAGGHGLDALRFARLAGARTAACHPAQAFPDADSGLAALPGCAWAVTVGGADREWAHRLVGDLGGHPVDVADHARTLYHAGLAMGANATAAVVSMARDLLVGAGIPTPEMFLRPLAEAAARHAAERGPAALTGPVRRGDAGTVHAHLDELRAVLPDDAEAYVALSRLALRHARRAGLDSTLAEGIESVLDEYP